MSKRAVFCGAVLLAFLPACQEDEVTTSRILESEAIVRVEGSAPGSGVDWNREFEFLNSAEVLEKAAKAAGTDTQTLGEATRFEVDLENQSICIIARGADEEIADRYAQSLSEAFVGARGSLGENRSPSGSQTLDEDRMTYEKALKALEEDPSDEIEVPVDGVLFKKSEDE